MVIVNAIRASTAKYKRSSFLEDCCVTPQTRRDSTRNDKVDSILECEVPQSPEYDAQVESLDGRKISFFADDDSFFTENSLKNVEPRKRLHAENFLRHSAISDLTSASWMMTADEFFSNSTIDSIIPVNEILKSKSGRKPSVLLGKRYPILHLSRFFLRAHPSHFLLDDDRIDCLSHGRGVVTEVIRRLGSATLFKVDFDWYGLQTVKLSRRLGQEGLRFTVCNEVE